MNCYLCNSSKVNTVRTRLRHDVCRNVLECEDCGLNYLEPGKDTGLKDYYGKEYRKLYTPVVGEVLNSREIFDIYLPFQQSRVDEIDHLLKPDVRVLDIGCSAGHFLYTLKDRVKECVGIEFDGSAADFVNRELGIKTYTEPIEDTDIQPEFFDLITAFHVLEHIDDPLSFLTSLSGYLKPGGFLCIEVPNIQDSLISVYDIDSYKDFWFREPHVFNYSSKTLEMMLQKAGFTGKLKTIQTYNFINQMNWILTGKPQKGADIGMAPPELVSNGRADTVIAEEFNDWVRKIDIEYKELLQKYDRGDCILFTGRKEKP